MLTGSRMDLSLAKTEPVSGGGIGSSIMYLRRKKKKLCITAIAARGRSENV